MGLIVEPDVEAPLRQGDILQKVALYATTTDGNDPSPIEGVDYVLLLSRHCNAVRGGSLVVAAITETTPDIFQELSKTNLDQARRALSALRDGDGSPDRFYLGPLPKRGPRRAFARLDLVFSIQVPEGDRERKDWISARRVGSLSSEHRRHLHMSLLLAFGREGFDDFAWWPDADLKLMIAAGTRELSEARVKQADTVTNIQAAPGTLTDEKLEKKLGGITKQHEKATGDVEDAQRALDQYLTEWRRRHGETDPMA